MTLPAPNTSTAWMQTASTAVADVTTITTTTSTTSATVVTGALQETGVAMTDTHPTKEKSCKRHSWMVARTEIRNGRPYEHLRCRWCLAFKGKYVSGPQ